MVLSALLPWLNWRPSLPFQSPSYSCAQRPLKMCVCVCGGITAEPWLSGHGNLGLGLTPVFVFVSAETEPPGRGENFHQGWGRAELVVQQLKGWATMAGPPAGKQLMAPCPSRAPLQLQSLGKGRPGGTGQCSTEPTSTCPSFHKHLPSTYQALGAGQGIRSKWPCHTLTKHLYIHV